MKVLETTIGSSIIPTYWRRFRIISPLPSKRKHFSACGEKRELNSEGDKRTPPEGCDTEGGAVAKPEEKEQKSQGLAESGRSGESIPRRGEQHDDSCKVGKAMPAVMGMWLEYVVERSMYMSGIIAFGVPGSNDTLSMALTVELYRSDS